MSTSTTVTLSTTQWAAQMKKLGNRFPGAALRGAKRGAMRAASLLQRATGKAEPANPAKIGTGGAVNTGFYKRAWKWEGLPSGARVYNVAPYAAVIETGRRVGATRPPIGALTDWAQRRIGLSREDARKAAFAISKAIQKRGLLPRKVMGNKLPEIQQIWVKEITAELAKELAKP